MVVGLTNLIDVDVQQSVQYSKSLFGRTGSVFY